MATNPALVSVCIPVYNGKQYIGEAIQSVLDQKYQNVEVLVQDNASTDGTWELLQNIVRQYPQVSIERNDTNIGMAPNWNRVIDRARGDYVMLLSCDDYLEPGFLTKCAEVLRTTDSGVVTTNHYWLRRTGKSRRVMPIAAGIYRDFGNIVLIFNPFSINFTLFRKEAIASLKQNGRLFIESVVTCDYDLWIRMALTKTKVHYLSSPLGTYRVHDDNISRQKIRMNREASDVMLAHQQALKKRHPVFYRLTIIRFILRVFVNFVRFQQFDAESLRSLYRGW